MTPLRCVLACAGLVLAVAAPASAQETILAAPPSQYLVSDVTVAQGQGVLFRNLDALSHDVVARDTGPSGAPLFASQLIGPGASSPVAGVESLAGGTYAFVCSIHTQMTGTITVTGEPAAPPDPAPPADTTAPAISLRVLDRSARKAARRGALRIRVVAGEAAHVGLTASAGGRSIAADGTHLEAGTHTVALRLTRAGRGLLRKAKRVKLVLRARAADAAGNASETTARRTLKR